MRRTQEENIINLLCALDSPRDDMANIDNPILSTYLTGYSLLFDCFIVNYVAEYKPCVCALPEGSVLCRP